MTGPRLESVHKFDRFLKNETSWVWAPASTRFHLAGPGGLVAHSVNVARTLLRLRDLLAPGLCVSSCVICGLYHDVGKVGVPGAPNYLPCDAQEKSVGRQAAYRVNQDLVHLDIASRSLFVVASHLELSAEEAQAIRYHDGQYIVENRSVAHRESKLTLLLQYADNWSGEVLESKKRRTGSQEGEEP